MIHLAVLLLTLAIAAPPESGPSDGFAAMTQGHVERLQRRLGEIEAALATNPPPVTRDRLLIDRLAATFELATIRGQPFDALERLATDALRGEPSPALATAADYWLLRVEMARVEPLTTSQPAAGRQIRRVEQFLERHRGAPEGPRLVAEVLEPAYAASDFVSVDRLLARLKHDYPDDPTTAALVGQDRLRRCLGDTWAPVLQDATGAAVDWSRFRGHPTLVVFWASWDPASRGLLRELSGWADLRVADRPRMLAISLDMQAGDARVALEKAGLAAILCCDEAGWASPLADTWGIRSLPVVLVLDGDGRVRRAVREVGPALPDAVRDAWRAAGGQLE